MRATTVCKKNVINASADRTLTRAESGSLCTNYGATGAITFNLPASPEVGDFFEFIVGSGATATDMYVNPASGDAIIAAGAVTSDGQLMADDEGEMMLVTCIQDGVWLAGVTGTWT